MKRSLISNACWGLCVVLAFALGQKGARKEAARETARALAASRIVEGPSAPPSLVVKNDESGSGGGEAAGASGGVLSTKQLQDLAAEAFNSPNPLTRNLAFAKLLESMTPDNVLTVMAAMRENRAGGEQWGLFQYAWGAMDGEGALKHAETLQGGAKHRFMGQALSGWASHDPAKAIAWLDNEPEGEDKQRYRWSLVGGLADHDIGVATDYALRRAGQGDTNAMGYLETIAGEEIRKSGASNATRWAESLPDGPLKGAALDRVAGSYVNENPEAAAAWAAQFANADYGARVIEEIGDGWAERDPKSALAWLEKLPESNGRSEGMHSALREWTQRDPRAASEYLVSMPASESKDHAVSGFARTLANEDPESAVIWAGTISDERARLQTLTRAGRAWYRRDAAAATAWMQKANLPESTVRAVIAPPRPQQDQRRRGN